MTTNQSLPPGWRMEALGPSTERRECSIRITTPEGRQITFSHKPFQFACDITRQLQVALTAQAATIEVPSPFRIARPEQLRVARDRRPRADEPDMGSSHAESAVLPERENADDLSGARASHEVEL